MPDVAQHNLKIGMIKVELGVWLSKYRQHALPEVINN